MIFQTLVCGITVVTEEPVFHIREGMRSIFYLMY